MNTAANKQLVRSFFENLAAGQAEACLAQMADTATFSVLGDLGQFPLADIKTKAQFGELLHWSVAAVLPKGVQIILDELTAEGDCVAVAAKVCGETGSEPVCTEFHHFALEVRDGKIQAGRECAVVRASSRERLGARESREIPLSLSL